VTAAKTICFSANSEVSWNKNNKQPVGAFAAMRGGARIAMRGFAPLYSCERADLVIKIDYNDVAGTVNFNVTDADSGDTVFREERSVSDLSSDVSRMAAHFQNMVADARAAAKVAQAEAQGRAKEEAFFASLPIHWQFVNTCSTGGESHCPQGPAIDVWISGDVLYEVATSDHTLNGKTSVKRKVNCAVHRGVSETEPWLGTCTYELFWGDATTPACTVETTETITSIRSKEITGRSQEVDYTPMRQSPPTCPLPGAGARVFKMVPATEKQ